MHNTTQVMHKTLTTPLRVQVASRVEIVGDVQPHHHPIVELVYYLEGQVQCRIGEEVVACEPGMVRLMPMGVIHGEIARTRWACFCLWVETPTTLLWPSVYIDDANRTFGTLFGLLVREWSSQAPERAEMVDHLMQQLDILLRRAYDQRSLSSGERLVREGERLLKERFATPVTISAIAEELRVSPSYLRSQFVRLRGHTPMSYLQIVRAQHAVALIRNSDLSLEAIARLCGYDSSSHLSRHVKQATGQRPGTFRLTAK